MESKKFRFYITDLFEGVITGTDDEAMARRLALSEDFFVVDSENNLWITSHDTRYVQELKSN
jgi:hypothetical protein